MKPKHRNLFIGCLIVLMLPLLCIGMLVWLVVYYPKLGRITDFHVIQDGDVIAGTPYKIIKLTDRFVVRNQVTGTEKQIAYRDDDSYYSQMQAYTVLVHKGMFFLITKYGNSGSGGGDTYSVFNLKTNPPYDVLEGEEMLSFSCTYPRLEGDALQFDTAEHCDMFPLVTTPIRGFLIKLPFSKVE